MDSGFMIRDFQRISQKRNPGWSRVYAKVLTAGIVRPGDQVTLSEKPKRARPALMMARVLEQELMDDEAQAVPMQGPIFLKRIRALSIASANTFLIFLREQCWTWVVGPAIFLSALRRRFRCAASPASMRRRRWYVWPKRLCIRPACPLVFLFRCERFQDIAGTNIVDAAISNSLLHHVPNPLQFWHKLRIGREARLTGLRDGSLAAGIPGSSAGHCRSVCFRGSDILRRDFYNSLLAAFTEDEISPQLARMNLTRSDHRCAG